MKFNLVACGGTFDHFHKGHKFLLRLAFSLGKKVVIGVTSDEYVKKLKINPSTSSGEKLKIIEPFESRRLAVLEFVESEKALEKVEIVAINDLFGPTRAKDFICDALVVSEASINSAKTINKERKKMGLSQLKIIVQKLILASDGKPIASFRIRNGEIDREGRPYINSLWLKHKLLLTEEIRKRLKKPLGVLIRNFKESSDKKFSFVITVGDVATKAFNDLSLKQNIAVVDFKVGRKIMFSGIKELGFLGTEIIIEVNNPAGCLTPAIFTGVQNALKQGLRNRVIIKIEGEEDLSVLPLILVAPLSYVIFYGQPNKGIVGVEISEENKKIAYGLVNRFEMLK